MGGLMGRVGERSARTHGAKECHPYEHGEKVLQRSYGVFR